MGNPPSNSEFLLCFSRGFLWRILVFVCLLVFLIYVGNVFLVAFAGVLLAVILRAVSGWLQRLTHLNAQWSFRSVLCGMLVVAIGLGFLLGPRVITQAHQIVDTIPQSLANIQTQLNQYGWGRDVTKFFSHGVQAQPLATRAGDYGTKFLQAITRGFIIFAIALFVGSNPALYRGGILQLLPKRNRSQGEELLSDIGLAVRGWLLGQMIPMLALGGGTLIGLWALGIPLAFTLALFTALMLFIPYIGSIIAFIPTALIALIQGPRQLLYVAILYTAVHIAEGYVITPISQKHTVRLPPALTLFSQLFMWTIAGFLGVVVATPLAAVGLVIVQKLYLHEQPTLRTD